MMERLDGVGVQGQVGRFRPDQIAQMSTWTTVPNEQATVAAMHSIRQVPSNGTTVTTLNPLDAGDEFYRFHDDGADENTVPAGRRL